MDGKRSRIYTGKEAEYMQESKPNRPLIYSASFPVYIRLLFPYIFGFFSRIYSASFPVYIRLLFPYIFGFFFRLLFPSSRIYTGKEAEYMQESKPNLYGKRSMTRYIQVSPEWSFERSLFLYRSHCRSENDLYRSSQISFQVSLEEMKSEDLLCVMKICV